VKAETSPPAARVRRQGPSNDRCAIDRQASPSAAARVPDHASDPVLERTTMADTGMPTPCHLSACPTVRSFQGAAWFRAALYSTRVRELPTLQVSWAGR